MQYVSRCDALVLLALVWATFAGAGVPSDHPAREPMASTCPGPADRPVNRPVPASRAGPPVVAVPRIAPTAPARPAITAPPPPVTLPRPTHITACDDGGCWDSEGRRLPRVGPDLIGPRGPCTAQGGQYVCP
jgi:hypothetical protein